MLINEKTHIISVSYDVLFTRRFVSHYAFLDDTSLFFVWYLERRRWQSTHGAGMKPRMDTRFEMFGVKYRFAIENSTLGQREA